MLLNNIRVERESVFQGTQLGVETVPGTPVAANKRLLDSYVNPTPNIPVDMYRPFGSLAPTDGVRQKEWTTGAVEGRLSYNDFVYLLSGGLCLPVITTPGGATLRRRWTFTPNAWTHNPVQPYTLEFGSPEQAERIAFTIFTALSLRITRTEATTGGAMLGQVWNGVTATDTSEVDTIALTGVTAGTFSVTIGDTPIGASQTATAIPYDVSNSVLQTTLQGLSNVGTGNVLVTGTGVNKVLTFVNLLGGIPITVSADFTGATGGTPTITRTTTGAPPSPIGSKIVGINDVGVYIANASDDTSLDAGLLDRCIEVNWGMTDHFGGLFTIDPTQQSFSNVVERPPNFGCSVLVEHDSNGAGLITDLRNRVTKYLRIQALSEDFIEGSSPWMIQIDMPVKLREPRPGEQEDIRGITLDTHPIYDPTFGGFMKVTVDNTLTAL